MTCVQHGVKAQFRALAELLEFSMGPTKDVSNDPCSPITLLVFRFASTRLSALRSEIITKNNDASNLPYLDYVDGGVQDECEVLMLKGLQQLQKVVEKQNQERAAAPTPAAADDDDESSWGLETAADAGYSLIECLRYVLHPAAYISGLTTIITKTEDAIQRKALRMLDAVVRQLSTVSSDGRPELSNERVKVAARDAVRCVQSILLSQKRGVEDGPSELTMQLALTVLGSFAQGIGQWEPDVFLGIIDGVLQQVTEAEAVPLRTGALATVAAVVQGLGLKVLPKLPAIISVVLQTAEKILAFENGGPQVDKPKTEDAVELELVALLSVISSLLHGLGAFIAPNLPQLLSLLFSSPVLSTFASSSKLDQIAALIRNQLPQKVPPRLFLPPMAEWLDAALEKNPQAIRLSIDMMQASISSLDAKSASNFHHLIFGSMMKVLDVRRRGLDAGFSDPGAALVVEKTAASALVELILKLSEGKFKPLFFRMIEWANATQFPEDSNVASRSLKGAHAKVARRVAFLHVINALCESLRSVFTPYFHFLMDLIIEILTMEDNVLETSGEEPSLKKQKKSSIKNTETSSKDGGIQPLMDLNHCRILAVRALHRCFLYDTSGFLDEARFERLMAPLVSQLQVESLQIDDAHRLLEDNCSDNDDILEAGSNLQSFPASDRLSRATICCLSQMALASGPSESRWRPLNHAILMKTRATEARNRLAALQSTYALANALQEEYLPLLPEALPFLAELLEDPEPEIEAAATTTVKMLEELSGEDLKEYLKV